MKDFDAQVYEVEDTKLSEEEKQIVDSIGEENADYCAAAVLQNRYPNLDVTYHEEQSAFEIGDEKLEINFDLLHKDSQLLFSKDEDYAWICEVVVTLEMLFELNETS